MPLSSDIQEYILQFGNNWSLPIILGFEEYFESCHAALPDVGEPKYESEKRVKYGSHERHRLDIYWPKDKDEKANLPVVVYFHGGAFRVGDNDISPHIYGNIGKFFASNNMIGILGTYRLLPEARFPDGLEDVTSALQWIKTNIGNYGGDKNGIFAIGQSAGGSHLAMALFSGRLQQQEAIPRGILLQSAAMYYDLTLEARQKSMFEYYGTNDEVRVIAQSALGLFNKLVTPESIMPELFITVSGFDFDECVRGNMKFLGDFQKKMKRLPTFEVLQGHNHISYCLSIGLDGDEVGPRIVAWIGRCLG